MSRRRGFTLVELLVVIAIIGMLIALLLPAVQAARESGRRASCSNSMRQMALALQLYHDNNKVFPPGSSNGLSSHAFLIPYLEKESISDIVNYAVTYSDPTNAVAMMTNVGAFICPSDPGEMWPTAAGGRNNYYGNAGVNILFSGVPSTTGANSTMPPSDGIFFNNSKVSMGGVKDGQSNTAAFSEKLVGDFSNGLSSWRSDTYKPGTYPNTPDEARDQCLAMDITNLSLQGYSNVGAPWLQSYHSTTRYWHVLTPNTRSCMYPPGRIATTPSSNHVKGVNLAMIDASVRYVPNTIDLLLWRSYGTRAGSEVVNDY
jgi:prepilin-type N-terminal cleavage/methylation domain-containing protein